MNQRKGFTLIELLVVIAIIAILAAILFPVFAQAKAAAKLAATISNQKQMGLTMAMYVTDVDDQLPRRATLNWNGWATGECNGTYGCESWDKLIIPYMKNFDIFTSGMDRSPTVPYWHGNNRGNFKRSYDVTKYMFPTVGGMSWAPNGSFFKPPVNMGSVPQVADTIMMVERRNASSLDGTWWQYSTYWENWAWGTGTGNTNSNTRQSRLDNQPFGYYRGIDYSNSNKAAFLMADGHVVTRPEGYSFQGHDRRNNAGGALNSDMAATCTDADEWSTNPPCAFPGERPQ